MERIERLDLGAGTRRWAARMEHAHLVVTDVERSADFYRRAFGFEVRYDDATEEDRTVHVGTDRFYLAMTEVPAARSVDQTGTVRIDHVGFVTEDLAAFRRHLEEEGIPILPGHEAHRQEGDAVYLRDPDRNMIEVVGYRGGYAYA